jgi:hypothetical protein
MVDRFINSYKDTPEEVVLDIDGWDDPTHGNQQLSCFHGYYGQHMYFPVLINEVRTGYPLVLQLRAGNSHSGKGVAGNFTLVVLAAEASLTRGKTYPSCRRWVLLAGNHSGL